MAHCPHCNRDGMVEAHIAKCPDNPAAHEAIGAALRDPQEPTRALSAERYNSQRVLHGAPVASVVLARYGTWANVCAEYGLDKPRRNTETLANLVRSSSTCPHCNGSFALHVVNRHIDICPDNPDVAPLIRDAMEQPDAPGYAVTITEYEEHSRTVSIPGPKAIKQHFGSWRAAVEHFGLKLAERSELTRAQAAAREAEDAAIADVDKMSEAARAAVAQTYEVEHTFHGYSVRDLPGVTVNGKPCQIVALR